MAHVKTRQGRAVAEHTPHIKHITGVQVFHASDGCEIFHLAKPTYRGIRFGISERRVKHSTLDICCFASPIRGEVPAIQIIRSARTAAAQIVVVERQSTIIENRVGFLCVYRLQTH